MKTIRIVKDWQFPDIMRQTPKNDGVWNGCRFTEEHVEQCDLLIVLNRPHYTINVTCPAGNRWLFMQEPPIKGYEWHKQCYKHFDQVFAFWGNTGTAPMKSMQTALPWHINKSYSELKLLSVNDCAGKKDRLSWVTSNASHKPGHKFRLDFKNFLAGQGFDYDLWGRGFNPIDDKFSGLFPYKYSLAIENYSCNDYWTEKIADCFLSWTMPIYWGAKNILEYFPEESMLRVDLENDMEGALRKIQDAVKNNLWEKNLNAIAEARRRILDEYQLFPFVSSLLAKQERLNKPGPATLTKIPELKKPKDRLFNKLTKKLKSYLIK